MEKKKKSSIWWWLLLGVVLAGVGIYLYLEMRPKPEEVLVTETEKVFPDKKEGPSEEQSEAPTEIRKPIPAPTEEDTSTKPPAGPTAEEIYCTKVEKNISEFFIYLDQSKYVRNLTPKKKSYARFKKMLKRLAARPPIPAGEGKDPKILIQNMYHFFRVLGQKDLRLIRDVVKNEKDTTENQMEMFYTWLMLRDRCPNPKGLRPSMETLYRYAGFFLNSTGGRAYLFRRSVGVRLLTSYYCILIVHKADRKGINSYGIDILPFIAPLREEMTIYPDFQFQQEYIDKLNQIENYYKGKRQSS